ncbi:MAG: cytochrome P460 family protein [Burkholderiales bacterium]|nr:cytochrome P460 family protein [Burkholderiales bacterium]
MARATSLLRRPSTFALALAALLGPICAAAADDRAGATLITACQACHGKEGISESAEIPNLAGQKQAYLVKQLQAFRGGTRKNDLMAAIAGQLGDDEMRALALVWSQLPGAAAATSAPAGSIAALRSRMSFPAGFPAGFTLYETVVDGGQVARRYANAVALRAAREGKPLPDGAAIIVANHPAQLDAARKPVLDAAGQPAAGPVLSYAGMAVRDGWGQDVPVLLRNGDWDYALFAADGSRRDGLNQAACLACHKPQAADSYVFTMKALRAATAAPAAR